MSKDHVKEEAVAERLEAYGEFKIEGKIQKKFDNVDLVMFKLDHNKYSYQRVENENIVTEKIVASDGPLSLGIFPVAPLNLPAKYATHMMLKLASPIVLDPKSHVDAYLTMPIEIAVVRSITDDVHMIDMFSLGKIKYALYGIPENGIICRYHETKISPDIPETAPYKEAALRVHFHNYTGRISTISRLVFPIEGADFYYRKHEAYYSDLQVIVEGSLLQTFLRIDVSSGEWAASRTNMRQKFDGKYIMTRGF
jgi:hypothetical protein